MLQEEKDLLLKDLCARLPYGVKFKSESAEKVYFIDTSDNEIYINGTNIEDCKPYLFPLSSMTGKQKEELDNLHWSFDTVGIHNFIESFTGPYREFVSHSDCIELIDWLNKNHFDYRGLIEKSLALDATGLNIY